MTTHHTPGCEYARCPIDICGCPRPTAISRLRAWVAKDGGHVFAQHDADVASLLAERDALQAFKEYCHQRMDEAGIPTHPNGKHSAAGCRIGDRFDILVARAERGEADLARLREALADLLSWFPDQKPEPEWRLKAGKHGADDAIEAARAALGAA